MDVLVAAGHYWPGENEGDVGIRGYTLPQLEAFAVAAETRAARARAELRADRFEDTAYAARAMFAKPDALKKLLAAYRQYE